MTVLHAVLMQSVLISGGTEAGYSKAYASAYESGRPLLVLVGSDENAGYQTMKQDIMPQLQANGDLTQVAYATVNMDQEAELAQRIMSGNNVPQLVMYYNTPGTGWQRKQIAGETTVAEIARFIKTGVSASSSSQSAVNVRTVSASNWNGSRGWSTIQPRSSNNLRFRGIFCIGGS
ncbi:MAG: hypothetical protein MPJ50_18565 [Pirellulales bacterium]|nr:hypothetical protein [Pirellulales bacterium]